MSYVLPSVPGSWRSALDAETRSSYFHELREFVDAESREHVIYPPPGEVYTALELTPLHGVRVLLLGQDPYPGPGHAHGLAFSVKPGVRPPPSLRNMMRELETDLGITAPAHGNLAAWARGGVLLLNTVLTVRAGASNSHKGRGWERFTDAVIRAVNDSTSRVVFALWGRHAQLKAPLVDASRHVVVSCAHPSPLSAHNGFFGSRPYSRINAALAEAGEQPIEWRLTLNGG